MDTQTDIEAGTGAESPESAAVSVDTSVDKLPDGWLPAEGFREDYWRFVGDQRLRVYRSGEHHWRPSCELLDGPLCTSRDLAMREAERLAVHVVADALAELATGDLPAGLSIVEANAEGEAGAVLRLHGRVVVLDTAACIRVAAELLRLATMEPSRPEECQGCSSQPYCAQCQETLREVVYG